MVRESEHRNVGREQVEVEAERSASNSCVVFLKSEAWEDSIYGNWWVKEVSTELVSLCFLLLVRCKPIGIRMQRELKVRRQNIPIYVLYRKFTFPSPPSPSKTRGPFYKILHNALSFSTLQRWSKPLWSNYWLLILLWVFPYQFKTVNEDRKEHSRQWELVCQGSDRDPCYWARGMRKTYAKHVITQGLLVLVIDLWVLPKGNKKPLISSAGS